LFHSFFRRLGGKVPEAKPQKSTTCSEEHDHQHHHHHEDVPTAEPSKAAPPKVESEESELEEESDIGKCLMGRA
jgi:hypothetical protein